jgi:protein associated with RNAse G/E
MKSFPVHSTKFDGSLHYRYLTTVVREERDLLVLYMPPGVPLDSYRGPMVTKQHTLQFYWADRFYNLHVNWDAEWQPRSHYVNIATPATWHDGALRFVDLDLDIIWRAATGEVILDDEDEFTLHQQRFGYSAELIDQAWRSSEDVRAMIARRAHPFDGSLHSWRPDGTA